MTASAYLVLASQRSGSTLLVESLRATGVAGEPGEFFQYLPTTSQSPQPRQWFEGVEDESILRLLDPLDEGKPDLAPSEIWRDYIRTVGRTPNGIWGGKLMWNQTPLLLQRSAGCPTAQATDCLPRSAMSSAPIRYSSMSTVPTLSHKRFRSGGRCRRGFGAVGPTRGETPSPSTTQGRSPTSSPCCGSRRKVGGRRSTRRASRRWRSPYPVLWRNLTQIVGDVLEALGLDPQLAPAPVTERQADQRSDEWVDRYRAEAERHGLPPT